MWLQGYFDGRFLLLTWWELACVIRTRYCGISYSLSRYHSFVWTLNMQENLHILSADVLALMGAWAYADRVVFKDMSYLSEPPLNFSPALPAFASFSTFSCGCDCVASRGPRIWRPNSRPEGQGLCLCTSCLDGWGNFIYGQWWPYKVLGQVALVVVNKSAELLPIYSVKVTAIRL